MVIEDLIASVITSFTTSNTLNFILIILVLFLLREADRYIKEHREMRARLTKLESKITAYEDLGVMDNLYKELRGKTPDEMKLIFEKVSKKAIGVKSDSKPTAE